jgi:N-acetylmuramoyl-L-alanine amidase
MKPFAIRNTGRLAAVEILEPRIALTFAVMDFDSISPAELTKFSGVARGDGFCGSVANTGDINGDGFPDLTISAQTAGENAGYCACLRLSLHAAAMITRLLLFFLVSLHFASAASPSLVIIDAGHGGKDSGGSGHGLMEKQLTLDTARRLKAKLTKAGVKNVMLRDTDVFIDLDDRVAMANKYVGRDAVLVSIHFNAVSSSAPNGLETFFWRPDATALAARIQKNVARSTGFKDVGLNRRRLRLTRNPEIPAVLVEGAFMTNPGDAKKLAQPATLDAIAEGICNGILELRKHGETGIQRVPEIASPLSRPTDPPDGGKRMRVNY